MAKLPLKTPPLLSIITPSFNREHFINQAIESVLRQNYPHLEHIIVDGASTDGTLQKLAKYSHLRIISENDLGMYDALNKGLDVAKGEIIGFLNTDDFYVEESFGMMIAQIEQGRVDAVAGQFRLFLQNKGDFNSNIELRKILTEKKLWRELIYSNPGINAWFFSRRVFERLGRFDNSYRISGDRDFLMRFLLSGLTYTFLDKVVYCYRVHSDSLTFSRDPSRISQITDENLQLTEHYLSLVPKMARTDMRRQRTRSTIAASARLLAFGDYEKARRYIKLGCRYEVFWLLKFILGLFRGFVREIQRKFGMYPPY